MGVICNAGAHCRRATMCANSWLIARPFTNVYVCSKRADAKVIHTPFALHAISHGRDKFYVHGHGIHGSDGCIVRALEYQRFSTE